MDTLHHVIVTCKVCWTYPNTTSELSFACKHRVAESDMVNSLCIVCIIATVHRIMLENAMMEALHCVNPSLEFTPRAVLTP